MVSQQGWGERYAINKELTHSTPFCNVELDRNLQYEITTKHTQSDFDDP